MQATIGRCCRQLNANIAKQGCCKWRHWHSWGGLWWWTPTKMRPHSKTFSLAALTVANSGDLSSLGTLWQATLIAESDFSADWMRSCAVVHMLFSAQCKCQKLSFNICYEFEHTHLCNMLPANEYNSLISSNERRRVLKPCLQDDLNSIPATDDAGGPHEVQQKIWHCQGCRQSLRGKGPLLWSRADLSAC